MCGRFTLFASYQHIIRRFTISSAFSETAYMPSYNVAPSQQVVAVIHDGKQNRLGYLRWGLIPPWAKDEKIGHKMINARAETLMERPSFRQPFQKKRCIIPADSFYEWKQTENGKVPMRIKMKSDELFSFAGLWESWHAPDGKTIHTCAIITTEPNALVRPIHKRMPAIIRQEEESTWLDRSIQNPNVLNRLLQPYNEDEMEAYAVSSLVNSPKNNNEKLIEPL